MAPRRRFAPLNHFNSGLTVMARTASSAFEKQPLLATAIIGAVSLILVQCGYHRTVKDNTKKPDSKERNAIASEPKPLLKCIRERRSIFPRNYDSSRSVSRATMERILEAAMWAPYHGPVPPWHFVVLGRQGLRAMQRMTIAYYDTHIDKQYPNYRESLEAEIEGRWGAVSFMVGIVVRRQAGSKRMPEWEEAAATACAVQNMHLQASAQGDVAGYWSSWHSAVRDSDEMHEFLNIGKEDRCLGFFIVAPAKPGLKDRRKRRAEKHLSVEWRADDQDSAA